MRKSLIKRYLNYERCIVLYTRPSRRRLRTVLGGIGGLIFRRSGFGTGSLCFQFPAERRLSAGLPSPDDGLRIEELRSSRTTPAVVGSEGAAHRERVQGLTETKEGLRKQLQLPSQAPLFGS